MQIVNVQRRTVSHAAAVPDAEGIGGFAKQLQCRIHDAAAVLGKQQNGGTRIVHPDTRKGFFRHSAVIPRRFVAVLRAFRTV